MSKYNEYLWKYSDSYEFMNRIMSMPPCIIVVACNGGIQGKEANPAIPEIPDEIAQSVCDAYKAGASMVHIHARNPEKLWGSATKTEIWLEDFQLKISFWVGS